MSGRLGTTIGVIIAAWLAGCSPLGGAAPTPQASRPTKLEQAQVTHEYPAPPPPPERVTRSAAGAEAAVRTFAVAYINWTAATVTAQMQELAANSIGQARAAMALAAAQTAGDYELRHGGVANRGTIEAVAPLGRHRNEYVVVTREQTTASNTSAYQGLRPSWHLALATVVQLASGGWVVSRWQPES